jgi:hypothetical protein
MMLRHAEEVDDEFGENDEFAFLALHGLRTARRSESVEGEPAENSGTRLGDE